MADVNVSELVAGMRTAAPVSVQGRMLVGEDVEITEKMISMFKTWGVARVSVAQDGAAAADALDALSPEVRDGIEARTALRFSRLGETDAVMTEIRRIAVKLEVLRMAGDGGDG